MPYERELRAVHAWLDETDAIALRHFGIGVAADRKADGTPVTVADRAIEAALRSAIGREFPGDAVLGEEEGGPGSAATRRWIVDPIDATKNFRRGIPVFATLVALEQEGALVLGVVSAPAMRTRWWARAGGGAFRDGEPIRVSTVADIAEAEVASGGLGSILATPMADGFATLVRRADRHRGFGDFWGHMLVAQGSIEIMVEPEVSVWDLAAPRVVVGEAGGRMTSLAGEDRIDAGHCVTTNGRVHDEVVEILRGSGTL